MEKAGSVRTALVALALLVAAAVVCHAADESVKAAARAEIVKAVNTGKAASAAIAVMDDGDVYTEAFGMLDKLREVPVNVDTQYNIGSVSKVFVATAVLQLYGAGRLNIDDPLIYYLPEFQMKDERYRQITIRMLLSHSAGLAGTNYFRADAAQKDRDYVAETLQVLRDGYLVYAPGTMSVYCNNDFTLAEALVERVSGMSYPEYVAQNIIKPAKMKNASCYFKPDNNNVARIFNETSGAAQPVEYVNALGSGGLSGTAKDLCLFARALWSGDLLTDKARTEFYKPQYGPQTTVSGTPSFNCGLGWDSVALEEFAGVRVLAKNGGTEEFSSQLLIAPDKKLAVAVTVAGKADVMGMAAAVMRSLLAEQKPVAGTTSAAADKPGRLPDTARQFAGYYGNTSTLFKIGFDYDRNVMQVARWNGSSFQQTAEWSCTVAGDFIASPVYRVSLAASDGKNYLLVRKASETATSVYLEKIDQSQKLYDDSAFCDVLWIPLNNWQYDLGAATPVRSFVPGEIPGMVGIATANRTLAYGQRDDKTLQVILLHAVDMSDIFVEGAGNSAILHIDGYCYKKAVAVPALGTERKIIIGGQGLNAVRLLKEDKTLDFVLPVGGRVLVFSADLRTRYDSLLDVNAPVAAKAGDYLVFAGAPGQVFKIK